MDKGELKIQNEDLRRDSEAVWLLLDAAGVPERGAHNSIRVELLIKERDRLRDELKRARPPHVEEP